MSGDLLSSEELRAMVDSLTDIVADTVRERDEALGHVRALQAYQEAHATRAAGVRVTARELHESDVAMLTRERDEALAVLREVVEAYGPHRTPLLNRARELLAKAGK